MNKILTTNKQNDLINQLQELWLSSEEEDDSIALSIFEIENLDRFTSPESAMRLVVKEARRYLRRKTDLISVIEPNRLVVTSLSSFIKHAHHQVRIHEMLKQPKVLNKNGDMESIKLSAGFAMFNYKDQKHHGIFDLYNLANLHLAEALKVGNAIRTQTGTDLPKAEEVPPLSNAYMPELSEEKEEDRRRSIFPWKWSAQ